jgi:hypothetical protein
MRSFVVVDGITLTRGQVAEAVKKLDAIDVGDWVQFADHEHPLNPTGFVVVNTSVACAHRAHWVHIERNDICLVGLDDGNAYSAPVERFKKVERKQS